MQGTSLPLCIHQCAHSSKGRPLYLSNSGECSGLDSGPLARRLGPRCSVPELLNDHAHQLSTVSLLAPSVFLRHEHFADRVMIESFDWRTLLLVQKQAPEIPTVYLTQVQQPEENIYLDKSSPWATGFDPVKYGGSVPRAVKAAGG